MRSRFGSGARCLLPRVLVLLALLLFIFQDTFAPARSTSLIAISVCVDQGYFKPDQCVKSVLPCVAPLALDPAKDVREGAIRTLSAVVAKLQAASATMSDSEAIAAAKAAAAGAAATPHMDKTAGDGASESGLLGNLGAWAVSSLWGESIDTPTPPTTASNAAKPSAKNVGPLPSGPTAVVGAAAGVRGLKCPN